MYIHISHEKTRSPQNHNYVLSTFCCNISKIRSLSIRRGDISIILSEYRTQTCWRLGSDQRIKLTRATSVCSSSIIEMYCHVSNSILWTKLSEIFVPFVVCHMIEFHSCVIFTTSIRENYTTNIKMICWAMRCRIKKHIIEIRSH